MFIKLYDDAVKNLLPTFLLSQKQANQITCETFKTPT